MKTAISFILFLVASILFFGYRKLWTKSTGMLIVSVICVLTAVAYLYAAYAPVPFFVILGIELSVSFLLDRLLVQWFVRPSNFKIEKERFLTNYFSRKNVRVGDIGISTSVFEPEGLIEIGGKIFKAESVDQKIEKNSDIIVISVFQDKIYVEPVDKIVLETNQQN